MFFLTESDTKLAGKAVTADYLIAVDRFNSRPLLYVIGPRLKSAVHRHILYRSEISF